MLKIRMQRTGRVGSPSYRIVVTEHARAPQAGNFVEKLGTYNPKTKERAIRDERVKYWLSVGAKPSGTMHNMLVSAGILSGKKVNVLPRKSPPKTEEAQQGASGAEAAIVAAAAASAEEPKEGEAEAAPEAAEGAASADAGADSSSAD